MKYKFVIQQTKTKQTKQNKQTNKINNEKMPPKATKQQKAKETVKETKETVKETKTVTKAVTKKSPAKKQTAAAAKKQQKTIVEITDSEATNAESTNSGEDVKRTPPKKYKFDDESIDDLVKTLHGKMEQCDKIAKDAIDIKHLIRDVIPYIVRHRKKDDKETEKKEQRKNNPRVAPVFPVTDALLKFMKLDEGTEVARTQAVSSVTQYIKAQNLNTGKMVDDLKNPGQQKEDKRYWKPDNDMKALFPDLKKSEYTHFNSIMGLLKEHFPKKGEVTSE